MNVRVARLITLLIASLGAAASAHHSFAMFDIEKDVTYKGVVTDTSGPIHTSISRSRSSLSPAWILRRLASGMSKAVR